MEQIDQGRVCDGLLFTTHHARALYIRTITLERPRWLKDHPHEWVKIADAQQAPVAKNDVQEPDVRIARQPSQNRSRSNEGYAIGFDRAEAVDLVDQVTVDPARLAEAELHIGGRTYVSMKRLAEILGVSERTLSRRNASVGSPPQVKIQGLYFELEETLALWSKPQSE
jgi:AraC-like DNA-binding protein